MTKHFFDLQGLRLAPLWILFIFVPQRPGHPILAIAMIIPAIALLYVWMRFCQRLYDLRFGWLQSNGYLPPYWSLLVPPFYFMFAMAMHRSFRMPENMLSLVCSCLLVPQVIAPLNPAIRRGYYAVGTCITLALFLSAWAPAYRTPQHTQTVVLGLTMMTIALLDHWLLFNTLRAIRQDLHA